MGKSKKELKAQIADLLVRLGTAQTAYQIRCDEVAGLDMQLRVGNEKRDKLHDECDAIEAERDVLHGQNELLQKRVAALEKAIRDFSEAVPIRGG